VSSLKPLSFPQDASLEPQTAGAFPYADQAPQPTQPDRMAQLEAMLKEVQGRAEIVEKEAYDKAYLAGEKAGMALGKKRGDQILDDLEHALQGTTRMLAAIKQAFSDAALDVGQYIAEQIIAEQLRADRGTLLKIAEQAGAQLPELADLRVAVSPEEFKEFKQMLDEERSSLLLVCDASVAEGSCRVISSQQDILIDPVAAVQRAVDQLRSTLQQSAPHDE